MTKEEILKKVDACKPALLSVLPIIATREAMKKAFDDLPECTKRRIEKAVEKNESKKS